MGEDRKDRIKLVSSQFGEMKFEREAIITFPEGLLGFEEFKRYVIMDVKECEPFQWLLSIDDPELGFPILRPALVYLQYESELFEEWAEGNTNVQMVYLIVTLDSDPTGVTADLKGPIVIDVNRRLGRQIILISRDYPTNYPLIQSSPSPPPAKETRRQRDKETRSSPLSPSPPLLVGE